MMQPDLPGGTQPGQGNSWHPSGNVQPQAPDARPPAGAAPPAAGAAWSAGYGFSSADEVSTYAPLPPDRLDGVSDLMIFG